jgi:transcriptional regulator with XRE-family HTH domain
MEEEELRSLLGANIKRFRKRRGWSQVKLAEKLDISTNFLSDIETQKGWVSPQTLVKLAKALDVEVYELFRPEQAMTHEITDMIGKITRDITILLNQSLEEVRRQYLEESRDIPAGDKDPDTAETDSA